MAKVEGKVKQTTGVDRLDEGADQYLKLLRDGTLSTVDFIGAMSLEGRVFTCNAAVATSAIAFGDEGLDTDEYDLFVTVPSSVVIIPLELNIHFETLGTALLLECAMQVGTGGAPHGTSTATVTRSSNPNTGLTSAVTSVCAANTGGTAFTGDVKEIWRAIDQMAIDIDTVAQIRVPYNYRWSALTSGVLDVVGPSYGLAVWASAKTGTGQISLKYAELPASAVQ